MPKPAISRKLKSESAFVLAMDIQGFSGASTSDHDKIITLLYPELARIVGIEDEAETIIDKKTVGDGFIFYFSSARAVIDAALKIQMLFIERRFWTDNKFEKHLKCRMGIHTGQFFRTHDAIEEREALFGRNIITAARLEPIVGVNEIWCTASFKAETQINTIPENVEVADLGKCLLAKGWGEQEVYSIWVKGQSPPPIPIRERDDPKMIVSQRLKVIRHDNHNHDYPATYFALIRLKHRSDGVQHLKSCLSESAGYQIEAVYYIFGAFDLIVRFKAKEDLKAKKLSKLLRKEKIIWTKDWCELSRVHLEKDDPEPIVALHESDRAHFKAFTYIKSSSIANDPAKTREIIKVAGKAFSQDNSIVTFYRNDEVLILPIVIRTEQYFSLATAIEAIEALVDKRHWENVSIITYPVHGLLENFKEIKAK